MITVRLLSTWALCGLLTACAQTGELTAIEKNISEQRQQLRVAEQEIKRESPPALLPLRQLHAELKYRPIQNWLRQITTPGFTVNVVGVSRSGDIAYAPGVGKAWLEPANHTKAFSRLQDLYLEGKLSGISWTARFEAGIEARARFSILGIGGNVLCNGRLQNMPITGELALSEFSQLSIPYTLRLSTPEKLNVRAGCGLGALGNVSFDLPVGSISSGSTGTVNIGLAQTGAIQLPDEIGGKTISYSIVLKNPQVALSPDSILVNSDIGVQITQGSTRP